MTVTERLLEQLKKEKYKIEAIYRKPLPVKTYICEEEVRGRSETDAVLSFLIKNNINPADYIITTQKISEDK